MEGLGYPLVPLAVDDSGSLEISEARPARKAKPGEKWDAATKTGADGTMGIDPANGQIASSSPAIVVGDVIIVGNSSMHGYYPLRLHNIPGHIRGFDVHTGKQLWNFNLVPQPGEFGADTWKNGSKPGTPGVGKNDAWAPYTADPELGLVYIPVGEGLSDEYGGHRPGNNLFANSVVALDAKTGVRKWHFQMVHHDIWDYDTPMAPNLLDVTVNGRARKIIAVDDEAGLGVHVRPHQRASRSGRCRRRRCCRAKCRASRRRPRSRFRAARRRTRSRGWSRRISSTTRRRSKTPRSSSRRNAAWVRTSFPARRLTAKARTDRRSTSARGTRRARAVA